VRVSRRLAGGPQYPPRGFTRSPVSGELYIEDPDPEAISTVMNQMAAAVQPIPNPVSTMFCLAAIPRTH
jgi:hypothetical protein